MSEKQIEKNFKLSAAFGEYVIDNPSASARVPNGVHIVMGDAKDEKFTQKNIEIFRNEKGSHYMAMKNGKKWSIEP